MLALSMRIKGEATVRFRTRVRLRNLPPHRITKRKKRMKIFQSALAVLGLSLLASAQEQGLPLCITMIPNLTARNIQLLVEVGGSKDPLLQEHHCITAMRRIQTFYSCKEGYEAVLTETEEVENLDVLISPSEFPENEKGEYIVKCVLTESEGSGNAGSITTTAPTQPPAPLCSSLTGASSINAYEEESRPRVVAVECQFSSGLSAVRTRTLYVCSEGEAKLVGPVYSSSYICPPASTTQPATTPTLPPRIAATLAQATTQDLHTTADAETTTVEETTTATTVAETTTTEKKEDPLCSSLTSYNSLYSFSMDSRSRVCRVKCRVPFRGTFRPRLVYTCCSGTAETLPGRSQATCPQ